MKSKYVLSGLLALSILALACIGCVAAEDYDYFPYLTSTPGGVIWTFKTDTFSGKAIDKTSIVAKWWLEGSDIHYIVPRQIILTDKLVTLVFNPTELPAYADGNSVFGRLTNGKTFLASGPGFAMGGHT